MAKKPAKPKICDACGAENPRNAKACRSCGKERFAPGWVRQLRRVNKQFAVQVTDAHALSDSDEPRLTLYKWWPGGNAGFNINTADQWEAVKQIVETDLGQFLGWKSVEEIQEEAGKRDKADAGVGKRVRGLAKEDPRLITEILKQLKLDKVSDEDVPKLGEAIGDLAQILLRVDEAQRSAIKALVKQLPVQGAKAVRELSELMEELTAGQIAAIAGEVQRRIGLLNTFKDRVLDDRTYEIKGDRSIHRLLERAMWIVDERYWLMHSNQQLRKIVTKELLKEDKKLQANRPDFVCGAVGQKLIIIEIKWPSHTLTVEDLNQLERYVVLCQKYDDDLSSAEAILVGNKVSDDLRRTLKVRGGTFRVRTYTQLISDTERRYESYLKALE